MEKKYHYGKRTIKVSNIDKLLFTGPDIKKKDLIEYYKKISNYILPHIKDRPLNMHRAPDGIGGEDFYQQEAPEYFPDWIKRVEIEKKDGSKIKHAVCSNESTLVYLANQACITLHIWLSKIGKLKFPDKIIFDLDPAGQKSFSSVRKAAKKIRDFFKESDIPLYIMTTGSKGLHVVIPIIPQKDFETVRQVARKIAVDLSEKYPDELTYQQNKEKRKGRLFVDYLRNSYGQTSVCPYSVRLLNNAPIATPISWEELFSSKIGSQSYNISNIFKRLANIDDPWKGIYRKRVSLNTINNIL